MFKGKHSVGLVTVVIALVALAIPVSAGTGETDKAAGGEVEDTYVQTGTDNTPVNSSGETDSAAEQEATVAPVQDSVVYVDGSGETDQYANTSVSARPVPVFELTRRSLALVSPVAPVETEEEYIVVEAGETDRYAGIETVEVPASSSLAFILGRGVNATP